VYKQLDPHRGELVHRPRRFITPVALIAFLGGLLLTAPSSGAAPQTRSAEWPQIGYDARRTSYNPHETILGPSTVARLKLRWIKTDAGYPVVGKGLLYAYSGGLIAAFDPISGAARWQADPPIYPVANPEYDAGRVYATGYGPSLSTLNAHTGAQLWFGGYGYASYYAAPVIMRGVYVSDTYGETFAYDEVTGELRWYDPPAGVVGVPAAANGIVFLGDEAVTASTGKVVWTGLTSVYSVMVAEGVLYAASGSNVSAYTATNGAPLWTTNVGGSTALAIANGVVYAGNSLGTVTALAAATGSTLWSTQVGATNYGIGAVAVANGLVYAGSGDGQLAAIDAGSGAVLWNRKLSGAVVSQIVVNGMLYATAVDAYVNSIYAFGL